MFFYPNFLQVISLDFTSVNVTQKALLDMTRGDLYVLLCFFPYFVLITAKECHNATGRCFWVANASSTTWVNSRTLCQQEGGDLAVMETEELRVFVKDKFM